MGDGEAGRVWNGRVRVEEAGTCQEALCEDARAELRELCGNLDPCQAAQCKCVGYWKHTQTHS